MDRLKWLMASVLLIGGQSGAALVALDETELDDVSGQVGLLNIDRFDHLGNNFYRVGANATIQTSVNIDKLLLTDGNGNPQIDIDHVSLNGGQDGNNNSTVSSAAITNPYIEFAFAGTVANDDISAREFIGVRFGAEGIDGFLSFGEQDQSFDPTNPADLPQDTGINFFRGFLTTERIEGTVRTLDSGGGFTNTADPAVIQTLAPRLGMPPFMTTGLLCIEAIRPNGDCGNRRFLEVQLDGGFTVPNGELRFPSVIVDSNRNDPGLNGPIALRQDGIVVNTADGVPVSSVSITTDILDLPTVPFRLDGEGVAQVDLIQPLLDLFGVQGLEIMVEATGTLENLRTRSTLNQELRFIHRTRVDGDATYLSFQNRALRWRGAPAADEAQPGWWLSIENPVDLGPLALDGVVLPDAFLGDILTAAGNFLNMEQNRVAIDAGSAIGGILTGEAPDIPPLPIDFTGFSPLNLVLNQSLSLGAGQREIRNCWNGQLGC